MASARERVQLFLLGLVLAGLLVGGISPLVAPESLGARPDLGDEGLRATLGEPSAPSLVPDAIVGPAFEGLTFGRNGDLENFVTPPDVQVAVGPDHVVQMVNIIGGIWTKDGTLRRSFGLAEFFGIDPANFVTDPRVKYDALSGRWFASITDITSGRVVLAVSASEDPLSDWRLYPLVASTDCADQPSLGMSDRVVVVSANDFRNCQSNPSYAGVEYWVINKTDVLDGRAPRFARFGPLGNLFSVHPAHSLGPTGVQYLVSTGFGSTSSLRLFRVTGVPPDRVSADESALSVRAIPIPPSAPQEGSRLEVDTGDGRVQDVFWRDARLWVGLNAGCTPSGDNRVRSCLRLLEIDTEAGRVLQDFDVGAAGKYYFYPALRPDEEDRLYVVFGSSAPNEYPSIRMAVRSAGDAPNTIGAPQLVRSGTAPEVSGCPTTSTCRYGDYFGASTDPADPSRVWLSAQYGTPDGWATYIFAATASVPMTFRYEVLGGGTGYGPPTLTYFRGGLPETATVATVPTTFTMDAGSAWAVSTVLPGSTGLERWAADGPTSGRADATASIVLRYVRQFSVSFSFSVEGGGSGYLPPPVSYVAFGLPASMTPGGTVWADAGTDYGYAPTLPGSTGDERWRAEEGTTGTVTDAGEVHVSYRRQFFVTFRVEPAIGGTVSPGAGWYDAGATLALSVAAPPGWAVGAWSGIGAGSYTGEDSEPTLVVGSPIEQTVTLYPGLTIAADIGGSVAYAYDGGSGVVPGGGSHTIYVPAGSTVRLDAAPASAFEFGVWSGDASGSASISYVSVDEPMQVRAHFRLTQSATSALLSSLLVVAGIVVLALLLWIRRRRRPPT